MKPKFLKTGIFVLLFIFIGTGESCKKDEWVLADENIEINSYPEIIIYKTKKDYINYVDIQMTDDGRINAIPSYNLNDPRISTDKNGYPKQNFRYRLKSGYVLDNNASLNEAFTNITIKEYVNWNTENGVAVWPNSLIEPRIIDKNPFAEFFILDGSKKGGKMYSIGELNDLIENQTLETVFTRLK